MSGRDPFTDSGAGAPDDFEAFCAGLLAELELGFPVHLAEGPDRGKDVVTNALLKGSPSRPLRIHLECKHSTTGAAISPGKLLTHLAWGIASDIDLLILATNTRFTAGVIDWIEQTRHKRSFGIVTWDGEQLLRLRSALARAGNARDQTIRSIHRDLFTTWSAQTQPELRSDYDWRLLATPRATAVPRISSFIDRDKELDLLSEVEEFSLAAISGPAGVGKTVLAHEALRRLEQSAYAPTIVGLSEVTANDLLGLVLPIAQAAEVAGSADLLDFLQEYQTPNVAALQAPLVRCLNSARLCVLFEDAHVVRSGSKIEELLEFLRFEFTESKVILTSRLSNLWPTSQIQPDMHLELAPFGTVDIERYLKKHSLNLDQQSITKVARITSGLPLMVGLACRNLRRSDSTSEQQRLESLGSTVVTLAQRLQARLTDDARCLFELLVVLQEPLATDELRIMLRLDSRRFDSAKKLLAETGLIRPDEVPLRAVHQLLKSLLAQQESFARWHKVLADYLAAFDRDPSRSLGRIRHLIEAGESSAAVGVLVKRGQLLVQAGLPDDVLHLATEFPPEAVSEHEFLSLAVVKAKALEVLSRHAEAYDVLETCFYPELLAELPVQLKLGYQLQQARNAYFLGRYQEVEAHLDPFLQGLQAGELEESDYTANALALAGRLRYIRRDLEGARTLYEQALEVFRELGQPLGMNKMRHRLAMIKIRTGDLESARRDLERVEVEARRTRDPKRQAYALSRLGIIARMTGDFKQAAEFQETSLAIKKILGHERGYLFSRMELARIALQEGAPVKAEEEILETLRLLERSNMPKEAAMLYSVYGIVKLRLGDLESAQKWTQRSIVLFEELRLPERASRVREHFEKEKTGQGLSKS